MKQRFCVVIPVFNNPETVRRVIEEALGLGYTVIVTDDGSTPPVETPNTVPNLFTIRHSHNQGKGRAILSGAAKARELGFESFVTIDADGQHFADQIEKLAPFADGKHIAIGARDFNTPNVPGSSRFGRRFSNFWVYAETGKRLQDTQSGFRLYPISILDLPLSSNRFDFEIEVVVKHLWRKRPVVEAVVNTYYPPAKERISHFDKGWDNLRLSWLHTRLIFQRWLLLRGRF